jgi:biopolymer transport protein ExbD
MARRGTPEVNAGSMADIAFLLLIFFIVATTMVKDTGLLRRLPPWLPDQEKDNQEIKERNLLVVLVNRNDQIMVEKKPTQIYELKEITKEFLLNPNRDEKLPEFKLEEIPFYGEVEVPQGVISLQNDRGTSYGVYLEVQDQLLAAANEVREELAMEKFKKSFEELSEEESQAVQKKCPIMISEAEPKHIQ